MTLWHLGEIGKFSFVQFHAFFDQFPADAGNDLFAPGIEQSGKCHATRRHRAAELAVPLHQQDARAGAPGLNGCDGSRGAAADDEHINLPGDLGLGGVGHAGGVHLGGGGDARQQASGEAESGRLANKLTSV